MNLSHYPFNIISSEVIQLLTASERHRIIQNELKYQKNNIQNDPHSHIFSVKASEDLVAYTKISSFRNRHKVIQIYQHNYQKKYHTPELLQELVQQIRDFYQNEKWISIHLNVPVGFDAQKIDPELAYVHCRYFLGRVHYFPIEIPKNYTLRIPTHSFDLVDSFEEMNNAFKFRHPHAEIWENTLEFDHWLNTGKCAVVYDTKNHPVAGIFMTYMKEFILHYPTWQIQYVITKRQHQNQGLAQLLRKFASNLALASQDHHALIGGIIGLWNTPSLKSIERNGRVPCLDRVLINRSVNVGYKKAQLNTDFM